MPYSFDLPVITDLTIDQQIVLNETKAIAVSGGPGTGKSVVALWRHIQNYALGRRKSLLLTYSKSLEYYLEHSANVENIVAKKAVNRTLYWAALTSKSSYDEIIVDEAQDVEKEIYEYIKNYTEIVSYSADDAQSLYPKKITEDGLQKLFPDNKVFTLGENFRNTYEITYFIKSVFPSKLIPNGRRSDEKQPKPTIICTNNNDNIQQKAVRDILDTFQGENHNIAILLPLVSYSDTRQVVGEWHNMLVNAGYKCSKFTNKENEVKTIENIHVTTFKSAKGLEFDTVIIPNFNLFRENINNLDIVRESDYYVALTRTKRNLYLIDNSNTGGNNGCNLVFLQQAIKQSLVEINSEYLKK